MINGPEEIIRTITNKPECSGECYNIQWVNRISSVIMDLKHNIGEKQFVRYKNKSSTIYKQSEKYNKLEEYYKIHLPNYKNIEVISNLCNFEN